MIPLLLILLRDDLARVELYEHRSIGIQLFYWYRQSKVIQMEKLKFQMVQLDQG